MALELRRGTSTLGWHIEEAEPRANPFQLSITSTAFNIYTFIQTLQKTTLCLAFDFWRTEKIFFAVSFLYGAQQRKTHGKFFFTHDKVFSPHRVLPSVTTVSSFPFCRGLYHGTRKSVGFVVCYSLAHDKDLKKISSLSIFFCPQFKALSWAKTRSKL
jgi:hypothetical protein